MQKRWLAIVAAIFLIAACFFPWATIESKNIVISGVNAAGTNFGKPGYLHLLFGGLAAILLVIPKLATIRAAILFSTFNMAWAIRNFIVIPLCQGGECPVKHPALYIVLISSIALLILNLFAGTQKSMKPL